MPTKSAKRKAEQAVGLDDGDRENKSDRTKRRELLSAANGAGSDDSGVDSALDGSSDDEQEELHERSSRAPKGRKALFLRGMHENHDDDSDVDADQTAEIEKKPVADIVSSEYKYKQRVMLLSSRGIGHRFRHMMNDLSAMLPHSKKDNKLDVKANVQIINELAELNNCNNCIFFEVRRHEDLYLWVSRTPNGPSARFFVQDVHTMEELRMIGNCLKGSRPIVSFDQTFDTTPQYKLIKELFTQVFSTPRTSRRIKPFVDHVLSFSVSDDRIWFRNYQIVEKEGPGSEISLVEIGPRFMLTIVRIFEGSFGGPTLYHSSSFVSPAQVRAMAKRQQRGKYISRQTSVAKREEKNTLLPDDGLSSVFKE